MKLLIERRDVKYCRVTITPDEKVRVVAPTNYNVSRFLAKKMGWIEEKIKEIRQLSKEFDSRREFLILNGEYYRVIFNGNLKVENYTIYTRTLNELETWIRNKLKKDMMEKVRFFSRLLGVKYGKVYIRKQKTKWASCSIRGNLSFNIVISALPENLKDYIVIHELAHLKVPRHGRKFWTIVSEYYPDYKKAEKELDRYWIGIERNNVWKAVRGLK